MLTLLRYEDNGEQTNGLLFFNGKFVADTIERPWLDNKTNVSCIPKGVYPLKYREGANFAVRKAYVLESVPARTGILIHVANQVDELRGCIAVGVKNGEFVYSSNLVFDELRKLVGDSSVLEIIGVGDVLFGVRV